MAYLPLYVYQAMIVRTMKDHKEGLYSLREAVCICQRIAYARERSKYMLCCESLYACGCVKIDEAPDGLNYMKC